MHIPFPLTPPDTPPEAYRTVDVTCNLTPGDLYLFATLPPLVLAEVMSAYLAQAVTKVFPPPAPERRTEAILLKWEASREARRMKPTIKWLLKHPAMQNRWFQDLQAAVQRSLAVPPQPSISRRGSSNGSFRWRGSSTASASRPPITKVRQAIIYTKRGGGARDYMPYELERLVRPLLP